MTARKLLQNNNQITSSCLNNHKQQNQPAVPKDSVSRMKPLTSGTGGPQQNLNGQTVYCQLVPLLLNMRLRQLGLRPIDVGGEGDWFFF